MTDEALQVIRERARLGDPLAIADMCDDTDMFELAKRFHQDSTALLAEVDRLRTAIERLASGEIMSRSLVFAVRPNDGPASSELLARIDYARAVFTGQPSETPKAG